MLNTQHFTSKLFATIYIAKAILFLAIIMKLISCNPKPQTIKHPHQSDIEDIIFQNLKSFIILDSKIDKGNIPDKSLVYIDDTLNCCMAVEMNFRDKNGKITFQYDDTMCNDLLAVMRSDTNTTEKELLILDTTVELKNLQLTKRHLNTTNTYEEFPNKHRGELHFSRLYFNTQHTRCLFVVKYFCGGLCGSGTTIYVEKINGKWAIKKEFMGWIS
jgi:hypothetical protein